MLFRALVFVSVLSSTACTSELGKTELWVVKCWWSGIVDLLHKFSR